MRTKHLVGILVLLALAVPASPAHADGIVSVRDEAHLLAALSGGGTVTFSCSGTIFLTATITIAADTTIDGSGHDITISGNDAVRVFTVNSGVTLNLNELTVANGSADFGGGIRNNGGTLTVSNSTFSGNTAGAGGAIANEDGILTVSNSTFSGNSALSQGGGMFLASYSEEVTVSSSTFSGNSANDGGGFFLGFGLVTVSNSTFFSNSANNGGAISNCGVLTVSNSTLSGNSANDGGGIHNYNGTVTLGNTIVANSPTGGNCSGSIIDGDGNLSYPDATCSGVNADPVLGPLQDNGGPTETMALGEGSAALDAGIDLTCTSDPVNSLDQRGIMRPQGSHCDSGAVEQEQGPAVISHVEICDETHLRAALAGGGMVIFDCSGTIPLTAEIVIAANTTIDGSGQTVTITGNHAVRVFYVTPGNTFILKGLTIADGSANSDGGVTSDAGVVIASHSTFSGHSGCGITNDDGAVTVSYSAFSGNSDCGIVNNDGVVTVSHSQFSGHSGGAIVNDDGTLTVSQSTFSANDGRSISNNGSEARLTVRDSLFSGNSGGGIFNYGIDAMAIVTNSTFVGNTTTSDGGGIYNEWGSVLTVSDSIFSSNIAGQGGGIHSYGNVTVSNCTFSGNSAGNGGGGITSFDSLLTVYNSTFFGNDATHGGAIHGNSGGITISNSTFSANHATDGGAIHNAGGLTVINSTFSGNHATYIGGIHNPEGRATLKNTIVANSPGALNCAGIIVDGGGNLSYPDTTCPGINADPMLGPLQSNGGPTETMALGPSSAAIDAGIDAICAAPPVNNLDQRGIARPQGAHCDIGALEQILEPAAVSVSVLSAQSLPSTTTPAMVAGLLLAMLVAVGIRRRQRHMI